MADLEGVVVAGGQELAAKQGGDDTGLEAMTLDIEESKKDRKKAPIRSQQNRSNMQNLTKKHKRLQESTSTHNSQSQRAGGLLKGPSNVIGGNSAAIPYRVSRVAQPTQHR